MQLKDRVSAHYFDDMRPFRCGEMFNAVRIKSTYKLDVVINYDAVSDMGQKYVYNTLVVVY